MIRVLIAFLVVAAFGWQLAPVAAAPALTPADPTAFGIAADAVEQMAARSRDGKIFKLTDGSFQAYFGRHLHYTTANGSLDDVDITLRADGSDWAALKSATHVKVKNAHIDVIDADSQKGIRWFIGAAPNVTATEAKVTAHSLVWEYQPLKTGVKVEATVTTSQGPQDYSFTYSLLGGSADFTIDADGNARSSDFTIPRPFVMGANGVRYATGPWVDIPGPRLEFAFDDTSLPADAYPYVIDPTTTFNVAASGDDGQVFDSGASYPPSASPSIHTSAGEILLRRNLVTGTYHIYVGLVRWDTSSLDDGAVISAATYRFEEQGGIIDADNRSITADWHSRADWPNGTGVIDESLDYVTADPAADAVSGVDITSITGSGENDFTLSNAAANISLTAYSGLRFHVSGGAPAGRNEINMQDFDNAGTKEPRLLVTFTVPSAVLTGTAVTTATEQEIRDGGETVIITLTNETWVAAGATFDAERQGLIDGLNSAQSETAGWNAEVRDKMTVGSVVRTSGTVVTITIAAADVGSYAVDADETITMTIPASALVTLTIAWVATPTFSVTAADETLAITGTLGGSGGTPAEIVAGGETIILTSTNTVWVASGATFDAQRQTIIDNLDSNLSDANGWDTRRQDFAVGDVVRTSDTVVTITLSGSLLYAIPTTEIITATAPAAAIFGAAIVGTPTFTITPTFKASGNRVTPAISLAGVTSVAYCAIGWNATTPTGTTATIETSVNGGSTYSSATNGSCPTGLTVGSSAASITDFRIRVSLTTTDSTVTPTVENLALLVQDASGPALYYQLNTLPGITITDRSANSNAGTMSFPVSTTGIGSNTGVLSSTRASLSAEQVLSVGDVVSPSTGSAVSGNIFNQTETGFGSLPFQSIVATMATGAEVPTRFFWVLFIGLWSIALGAAALIMTKSLMIAGVSMAAGLSLGAAIGAGLIPGWTVILFVILALSLIVLRARGALPL